MYEWIAPSGVKVRSCKPPKADLRRDVSRVAHFAWSMRVRLRMMRKG